MLNLEDITRTIVISTEVEKSFYLTNIQLNLEDISTIIFIVTEAENMKSPRSKIFLLNNKDAI